LRRTFALAIAGVALAAGAEPKATKLQPSADGAFGIRMVEEGPDACRLEVVKGTDPSWTLDKCVGNASDLYFVSNDGQRFWVLHTTPEKPGPPQGKKKGTPWYQVEVASLHDARGNVVQSRRLMDLVLPLDRDKVRQLGKHFMWIGGVDGVPGKPPRINDAGQVEVEVSGARTLKLSF